MPINPYPVKLPIFNIPLANQLFLYEIITYSFNEKGEAVMNTPTYQNILCIMLPLNKDDLINDVSGEYRRTDKKLYVDGKNNIYGTYELEIGSNVANLGISYKIIHKLDYSSFASFRVYVIRRLE